MPRPTNQLAVLAAIFCASGSVLARADEPESLGQARAQYNAADGDLNRVWKLCTAPEAGSVAYVEALKQSQRKWIELRDATARAYQIWNSDDVTGDDKYALHAKAMMTLSRVDELKRLFGCEE